MALLMKPEPFSSEINRLFDTLFEAGNNGIRTQRWAPAMDLVEADDHFVLKADLPGLGEDDVSIEVQDNVLTISGERKSEQERKEKGWYRLERSFGRFSRSLTLPEGVNPDAISAHFDKGVLEVSIPKPEEPSLAASASAARTATASRPRWRARLPRSNPRSPARLRTLVSGGR